MTQRRRRHRHKPPLRSRTIGTARRLAYDVLTAWEQRGAFAGRVLDELCRERSVDSRERAFALELSYTAIRRQATIDAVVTAYVDRPRNTVEDGLWRLLQLGVCQLVLMEGVPPHAALHETAELAGQLRHVEWKGLINGVLRAIAAAIQPEKTSDPGTDALPVGREEFLRFDRPLFADPQEQPAEYLAKAFSYPRWLTRQWLSGCDFPEAMRLCRWFNVHALPAIRVNLARQETPVVRQALAAVGIATEPGQYPESLIPLVPFRPNASPGFAEGWFSIQDESAMAASRLLDPQSGDCVLDTCAAPGGKACHLAELMRDGGTLVALDVDESRLALVREGAERLGLRCIQARLISANGDDVPQGPFDGVMVDVPCSNTGVLGKRPEARWRISPQTFDELVPVQTRLLQQAVTRLRRGGCAVYSTCSIDRRENREVVDRVLRETPGLTLEQERTHVPGRPADGGYQARLRRH